MKKGDQFTRKDSDSRYYYIYIGDGLVKGIKYHFFKEMNLARLIKNVLLQIQEWLLL
jgi:hypothetical protein